MNTPEQNIVKVLNGKKVLFLENDNRLENGLDMFESVLKRNKIEYHPLFRVDTLDMEYVTKMIKEYDVIVFQTQWTYEISKKIHEFMLTLKQKKIVIEVYIHEPTWYYKPDVIHDVYIYSRLEEYFDPKFYKLSKKAYWDYKNEFDK